jgi:hypothetical protein
MGTGRGLVAFFYIRTLKKEILIYDDAKDNRWKSSEADRGNSG